MTNDNDFCQGTSLCDFQKQVDKTLLRHKSILDIMTKMEEYNSRINRAVAKSVTMCGCIEIHASKQNYEGDTLKESAKSASSHVTGELCPSCKENLEHEIGSYLFYMMALCNTFEIDISEVLSAEYINAKALGFFSMK